jgi:hypothetical protein
MQYQNGGNRILVAIEPRAYREALAGVLMVERPEDEVIALDPGHVGVALRAHPGALVVHTQPMPTLADLACVWMFLGDAPELSARDHGLAGVLADIETALAQVR